MARRQYINTSWELWVYDVWGNADDGWEVNDGWCYNRAYDLRLLTTVNNVGTVQEFTSASPTDGQIRQAFGLKRVQIDTDGDDTNIYITYRSTGQPIGEMRCTSHRSLSPIEE